MKKPIGAQYMPETGSCIFTLWAPEAKEVDLIVEKPAKRSVPMEKDEWGHWKAEVKEVQEGTLYKYQVNGNNPLPDPASRFQPEGPHGPSAVVSPDYSWTDTNWTGIDQKDLIIYELHVGTFSPEGTFEGVEKKLDHLLELGVNAIEIMPVSQFPGNRNWGYDGVDLFAVHNGYGGPEGFRKLVDACHHKGIAVVLDVVYNHFGPEGNYLSQYGPYFTDKYNTPWGQALNYDDAFSDPVRNFFLQNALMWLNDYHVDGLRLDAVHAIKDLGAEHFLARLSKEVEALEQETGRKRVLIAEVDLNDNRFISHRENGGFGLHSQWVDEFHHAIHALLTGETIGYYSDFGEFDHLIRAYKDTYVYNGIYSPHRKKIFGSSAEEHPYHQFVVFAQNHDQVGNRMLGERLSQLVSFDAQKLAAAAYLFSPYLPMLFMGEEWGEKAPFYYFVSHTDPDLVEAVRKGRKSEFADFHGHGEPPDPQSEETFQASKLNWNFRQDKQQQAMWNFYKRLIDLRKSSQVYRATDRKSFDLLVWKDQTSLGLLKKNGNKSLLTILNFSKEEAKLPLEELQGSWKLLLNSDDHAWMGKGSNPPVEITGSQSLTVSPYTALVYQK